MAKILTISRKSHHPIENLSSDECIYELELSLKNLGQEG